MQYLIVLFLSATSVAMHIERNENQILQESVASLPLILDQASMYEAPKISFVEITVPENLKAGVAAIVECKSYGAPPPSIVWYKNGIPFRQSEMNPEGNIVEKLLNLGTKTVQEGGTSSQLVFECLDQSDTAEYTCEADNGHTQKGETVKVVVETGSSEEENSCLNEIVSGMEGSAPVIHTWTHMRLELDTANVQMYCRAYGNPLPKITWYRATDEGEALIKPDDQRYSILSNGDLLIKQDGLWDAMADYVCLASNKYGASRTTGFLYPTDGY